MWNFSKNYCDIITHNTEKIIEENGYPLEKHEVTTEDGYINSLYRIPHGRKKSSKKIKRSPVILFHGMACSCAEFTNQGKLAFYLADQNFDVWLPNNRGTTFSRKHKYLDSEKDEYEYWKFTWHEIGLYDFPAFIDYVINKTKFNKPFLIGHSQGVTSFGVLMSEKPEYNNKIQLCCLLGPAIIFDNTSSLQLNFIINFFIPIVQKIHKVFRLPIYQMPFLKLSRAISSIANCNKILHKIAQFVLFLVAGHSNYDQLSQLNFNRFSLTTPNTFSIRQVYHYYQIVKSRKFSKYDYGPKKNIKCYGTEKPPQYDLSKITTPVALFYGKNDMYSSPKDVEKLEMMLGNVVYKHLVDSELFNHADFILAKDSRSLVHCHIVDIMGKYEKKLMFQESN